MSTLWAIINMRALSVSVAQDAFNFEVSWLGILLVFALMFLWRRLRR
jgi:hypothetical protein